MKPGHSPASSLLCVICLSVISPISVVSSANFIMLVLVWEVRQSEEARQFWFLMSGF